MTQDGKSVDSASYGLTNFIGIWARFWIALLTEDMSPPKKKENHSHSLKTLKTSHISN